MWIASSAPFLALSMPTVATGIPGGIWAMLSSASSPPSFASLGTPITGRIVWAAMVPGRAADSPAIAMNTSDGVASMYCLRASGFLWADNTTTSWGMLNSVSMAAAFSPSSLSDLLPITMDTWVMLFSVCFVLNMGCEW